MKINMFLRINQSDNVTANYADDRADQHLQGRMAECIFELSCSHAHWVIRWQFSNNHIEDRRLLSSVQSNSSRIIHDDQGKYKRHREVWAGSSLENSDGGRESQYQRCVRGWHSTRANEASKIPFPIHVIMSKYFCCLRQEKSHKGCYKCPVQEKKMSKRIA